MHGVVQGVGFRPFVYRLATALAVEGFVRNVDGHVVIEAAGSSAQLDELARSLVSEAPPLARVRHIRQDDVPTSSGLGEGFRIIVSDTAPAPTAPTAPAPTTPAGALPASDLPPDVATCDACLAELFNPADRRYRHPFINCTDCGPRATIVEDLPYDRSRTVMSAFDLCAACTREYRDPANRRFHAEPIACPDCGPTLAWHASSGARAVGGAALAAAEEEIRAGRIVAIKGLGGYQLVCDATRDDVVAALRARKRRPRKPFAVMAATLDMAHELGEISTVERVALTSRARPIVLLDRLASAPIADEVAPGLDRIGVFLPYTPLHHLLLADLGIPLVVTSGNRANEPMALTEQEATARLAGIADGFLHHDRPIRSRHDDSVVQLAGGRIRTLRRARGFAPAAVALPVAARPAILALGAELKHTFTIANGRRAVIGPHTGDLEDADTFDSFVSAAAHLCDIERVQPGVVAHDLHPGYLSTQYAMSWNREQRIGVQHHHAHVAACAAEFGLERPFIGVAYDGLGYGDDATLWGGEILLADLTDYRRVGRFSRAPMPGGAAAIRRPARMALGYLFGAERFDSDDGEQAATGLDVLARLDSREVDVVRRMVQRSVNSPLASSAGRLFDAVACLLGLGDDVSYEGENAVALEAATTTGTADELPWALRMHDGLWVYDVRPTLRAVADGVRDGVPTGRTAAGFHRTITAVTLAICEEVRRAHGVGDVCLSGGVFQNRLLTAGIGSALTSAGFSVYVPEQVPCNDGGISFGQAAVAAARTSLTRRS